MSDAPEKKILDMEVVVSEEDNSVYIKLSGFDTTEDADEYAAYLVEALPLMLFRSETKH